MAAELFERLIVVIPACYTRAAAASHLGYVECARALIHEAPALYRVLTEIRGLAQTMTSVRIVDKKGARSSSPGDRPRVRSVGARLVLRWRRREARGLPRRRREARGLPRRRREACGLPADRHGDDVVHNRYQFVLPDHPGDRAVPLQAQRVQPVDVGLDSLAISACDMSPTWVIWTRNWISSLSSAFSTTVPTVCSQKSIGSS